MCLLSSAAAPGGVQRGDTIIAERRVEAADVRAGQRVLDVACGQGNAAEDAAVFAHDLAEVARQHNRAQDGTVAAPADYLEAAGNRRG